MSVEREPIGITYDRYRLGVVQAALVRRFGWKRILEVGAGGAKAKPSLYSIGFARAGCHVDLVGGDRDALGDWRALGLGGRIDFLDGDVRGLAAGKWDAAWNFVTAGAGGDLPRAVRDMARVARFVMTVHCNGMHWGRPWHMLLHAIAGLEWTHGRWKDEFPGTVGLAFREAGLGTAAAGFFDAPGWPDPPGFRDIRLHLDGITGDEERVGWEAPIVEIYRSGRVPVAIRLLEMGERLQPLPLRALNAHLYYHVGERVEP